MSSPALLCGLGARIRSIMPVNADRLHAAMLSNAVLDPVNAHIMLTSSLPLLFLPNKYASVPRNRNAGRQPIKHENFRSEFG
jgi:hypothetical protein